MATQIPLMNAGDTMTTKGFTLIELLVTIAVIIIIATIALPNFRSLVESNRLAAEYNNVLTGLHFARSEAVKSRKVIRAEIRTELGKWEMEVKEVKEVKEEESESVDPIRVFSSTNGNIEINEGNTGLVEFDRLGRRGACTFTSCQISIGDKKIEINATGNIARPQT